MAANNNLYSECRRSFHTYNSKFCCCCWYPAAHWFLILSWWWIVVGFMLFSLTKLLLLSKLTNARLRHIEETVEGQSTAVAEIGIFLPHSVFFQTFLHTPIYLHFFFIYINLLHFLSFTYLNYNVFLNTWFILPHYCAVALHPLLALPTVQAFKSPEGLTRRDKSSIIKKKQKKENGRQLQGNRV